MIGEHQLDRCPVFQFCLNGKYKAHYIKPSLLEVFEQSARVGCGLIWFLRLDSFNQNNGQARLIGVLSLLRVALSLVAGISDKFNCSKPYRHFLAGRPSRRTKR